MMIDSDEIDQKVKRSYRAMRDANDAFRRELVRVYGKDASSARFYYQHEDAEVKKWKAAKWLAEDAHVAAVHEMREAKSGR